MPADILLLRGLGRESGHWGEFVDQLEAQKFCRKVICLDLPGTGPYRKLSSPLTIEENAQFILTQLEHHKFKKINLVAVSLGAMVGAELLRIEPDLFDNAVFMNTSFSNLSPIYHRLQLATVKRIYGILKNIENAKEREQEVLRMVSSTPEDHPEILEQWTKIAEERPIEPLNILRQLVAAARYKVSSATPNTPVTLLNSSGDQMVSSACSEALSKHWTVSLITHPTAGHDIVVDDPDWVVAQLTRILK